MSYLRIAQAAKILGVSPQTVRNLCKSGEIPFQLNTANQRIFLEDDVVAYKRKRQGLPPLSSYSYYYVRTSSKNDVSLENQTKKLRDNYEKPDKVFEDVGSGLNDKRKDFNRLIDTLEKTEGKKTLYITNKDRLTRFNYRVVERYFNYLDTEIVVLDSDETKEPLEVLMQDFMSLLASFSGKFYRLRGWTQRKEFLTDVQKEVDRHVK